MLGLIIALVLPFMMVVIFVYYRINHTSDHKTLSNSFTDYLARDQRANLARKKNFGELDGLIQIDISRLPTIPEYGAEYNEHYKKALELQCAAFKKAELPMIHFTNLDNIQIKERYGIANFKKIIAYEEHFNDFIQLLLKWSGKLIDAEQEQAATTVLEYALEIDPNFSKLYTALADIYLDRRDGSKLADLRQLLDANNIGAMSGKISAYIEDHITKLNSGRR